jgi:hypothetical protein
MIRKNMMKRSLVSSLRINHKPTGSMFVIQRQIYVINIVDSFLRVLGLVRVGVLL